MGALTLAQWGALEWLAIVEHELLLFAGIFFLIGALDELAMDGVWAWLRLTGRARTHRVQRTDLHYRLLAGKAAVLIPAWQEAAVIGHTIAHALRVWPQADLRIYVGCYCNDPLTMEAAITGAGNDPRVRLVVHDRLGPSTKADCLNRLYTAMDRDEQRSGESYRMVVLHDAEDMVDPGALALMDRGIEDCEFVQLPVLPLPQHGTRWIGSHYCEEFAEAHGKAMVVRGALGANLPAAGVGCAFSRQILRILSRDSDSALGQISGPFNVESLTEDYELGMRVAEAHGRAHFLRVRGGDGQLIATRAYFPAQIDQAVRQKARWVHGIALQGWDRLGWSGGMAETWMRLRDRRGPLSALVLLSGYSLFLLASLTFALRYFGLMQPWQADPLVEALIWANLASFAWRAVMRFAFTAREYGAAEGARAVLRIPLANVIAIMAGRRAMAAYIQTLMGAAPHWEKTQHDAHPAAGASPVGVMG